MSVAKVTVGPDVLCGERTMSLATLTIVSSHDGEDCSAVRRAIENSGNSANFVTTVSPPLQEPIE